MSSRHQNRFSINVWLSILSDQLLGPGALPNSAVYHHFLVNNLPVSLEHVPLYQWQHIWFMHDGATPLFFHTARLHLNQIFGEEWIRHGGSVNWPAWPPDLNPPDFLLWGHLKTCVFNANLWLTGITAMNKECPAEYSSQTRNFWQNKHLCATKSRSCVAVHGNHRAPTAEITRTSPTSQQVLVSGHTLTGRSFAHVSIIPPLSL
jgi:hypothetical protein